ncbi:hypothetical protein HPB48_003077 [Haemaphysalis longicornis]|uniref:Ig-like domain-containing protein n=1 Tax=Haemaphysalis longicornis TaxID=44386 RepID=A0A9J6FSC7_HAELO|nr:hypothetical protein HPB48_003077 [Haemaphysalis longicornis]
MHCTAQAPQRPSSDVKISWLRNGLPFPTSSRYRDLGNGLVYISDAMPKDSAVYTCVATDLRKNCTVQESALLRVLPRVNIEESELRYVHSVLFCCVVVTSSEQA